MAIIKGDFIEIEFTGRVKDGNVFDTNKKEVSEREKLPLQKPLIICVGYSMVVAGFDKALEGKEINQEYTIELSPKEAFGERQPSLVRTIPIKVFYQQKINPQPGMSFMMDNYLVRISAVSGGRVTADFNNPLAGKKIIYIFTIKRRIENPEEKVKATLEFFFNQEFSFKIEDNKIVIEIDKNKPEQAQMQPMMEIMKDKLRDILKLDIEIKIDKKQENTIEQKPEIKMSEEKTEKKEESGQKETKEKKAIKLKTANPEENILEKSNNRALEK